MIIGRERSSWCEWNSRFPRVSWTERCQGKGPHLHLQFQCLNCRCCCLISYVTLFLLCSGFSWVLWRKGEFFFYSLFSCHYQIKIRKNAFYNDYSTNHVSLKGESGEIGLDGINGEEVRLSHSHVYI